MNRIIFLNQETGPLLIDMINVFAENNIIIILYTGEIIKTSTDLNPRVKVRKLCKYRKNNNLNRLFTWSLYFLQSFICLIYDLNKDTKIYFSSNPPFAPFLSLLFKNKAYIHVYDVYPDALLALPYVTKSSIVYKLFLYLNKKVFKKARKVFTPSYGMKEMLMKSTIENKIKIIPWWADTEFIKPIKKEENNFILEHKLNDKFIVMYSGNLGLTHNIEKVLNAALLLKDEIDLKFVIIGGGPKKKVVNIFEKKHNLENLLVLPFQDANILPYSLTASDVSIVLDSFSSNDGGESTASIPSKVYYLMSAGSVIYAEADKESELNRLINLYDIGVCDDKKDAQKMIEFIGLCRNNKKKFMDFQSNSRKASLDFTKRNANLLYETIIKD